MCNLMELGTEEGSLQLGVRLEYSIWRGGGKVKIWS